MPAMPTRTRGVFSILSRVVLLSLFLFLAAATSIAYAATPHARVDERGRVSVTAVAGNVAVTMAGAATDVQLESALSLPARIVTGSDGMLGLTQAGTNITVAGDTDIEIPAEAVDGNLVARLVQHRGNVFYDVAHRDVGKLRVETPYLVAVIKGTQFNVAVQEDGATTISLFEGQLEIGTPDGSEVIQLNAGEIAIRSLIDDAIQVVGMNEERVQLQPAAGRAAAEGAVAAAPADQTQTPPAATERAADVSSGEAPAAAVSTGASAASGSSLAVEVTNDDSAGGRRTVQISSGLDLGADKSAARDAAIDRGLSNAALGVSPSSGGIDPGLSAKLDLDAVHGTAGVDAGLNLGARGGDLGLAAGVNVGSMNSDLGLGANLDLSGGSAAASLDVGMNRGPTVDVGLDTNIDLRGGGVDLSLDTRLDLGGMTPDLGGGAAADLGRGNVDVGLEAGIDLGGNAGVGAGLDAGLDVGGGTLDVGLDTGVDLGAVVGGGAGIDPANGNVGIGIGIGDAGGVEIGIDPAEAGLQLGIGGGAPVIVIPPVAPVLPLPPILGGGSGGGGLGGLLGRH
jgi:hypothetical protein